MPSSVLNRSRPPRRHAPTSFDAAMLPVLIEREAQHIKALCLSDGGQLRAAGSIAATHPLGHVFASRAARAELGLFVAALSQGGFSGPSLGHALGLLLHHLTPAGGKAPSSRQRRAGAGKVTQDRLYQPIVERYVRVEADAHTDWPRPRFKAWQRDSFTPVVIEPSVARQWYDARVARGLSTPGLTVKPF